jgi:hypothetical protein
MREMILLSPQSLGRRRDVQGLDFLARKCLNALESREKLLSLEESSLNLLQRHYHIRVRLLTLSIRIVLLILLFNLALIVLRNMKELELSRVVAMQSHMKDAM